jgi:hypothetical protein
MFFRIIQRQVPTPRRNGADQAALRAFFHAEGAAHTDYRFTWKDVEEAVLLYTNVKIDADSLNQFATGQVSRGKVRGMSPKNLQAIVDFLTDPEIRALSLEELKEPEIPYHFALHLMPLLWFARACGNDA